MSANDDAIALLKEMRAKIDRLLIVHAMHGADPVTRTTTNAVPFTLHGPGTPCCDAYGDHVCTHDGSAPQTPTGLPNCDDDPPSSEAA